MSGSACFSSTLYLTVLQLFILLAADCYHVPIIFKFISLNTHATDVGYKGFDMDYDTQPCLRQMIF